MSVANVIPIRDPDAVVTDLIYELASAVEHLPSEDIVPGYLHMTETRVALREMAVLLQASRRLLKQAVDRERPRYEKALAAEG